MNISSKGFTLIELMIVIVILVIMMTITYAPYTYFQQKAKLKIASREISQSLYEGRNLAISGIETKSGSTFSNNSVGVFLDNTKGKNHQIYFYTYPHDTKTGNLVKPSTSSNVLKIKKLQNGVLINGEESILFFYEAITGNPTVIKFKMNNGVGKIIDTKVDIDFSYKNATSKNLQKTIDYNPKTNTVNYK